MNEDGLVIDSQGNIHGSPEDIAAFVEYAHCRVMLLGDPNAHQRILDAASKAEGQQDGRQV